MMLLLELGWAEPGLVDSQHFVDEIGQVVFQTMP